MPTYDFRCPVGHDFERFFGRISEAPSEVPCPECGAVAMRRISGGAGLVFKGSGFYITDYGKDGKKSERAAAAASKDKAGEKAVGEKSTADAKETGDRAPAAAAADGGGKGEKGAKSDTGAPAGGSTPAPKADAPVKPKSGE